MLSCKDVSRLLSDSQGRPLGFWMRLQVRLHLLICRGCDEFARQVGILRAALQRFAIREETLMRRGLSQEARDRIRARLTQHRD